MKTIVLRHSVDWIYCDPAGIMFYPEFYIWFDQATEHLFTANGLSYECLKEKYNLAGLPLVESGAKYETPCKHGEKVELHTFVEEWAGKTFLMNHTIYHESGTRALQGFERRVWAEMDPESPVGMRAKPVPAEVQDLFKD
ncbi:MAG: acyl-CoA thioesterase [Xanthomonadales bacterium]